MPNRHAALWFNLCAARKAGQEAKVSETHVMDLTKEQQQLKQAWENAWHAFRVAMNKEGPYTRHEDKEYSYTSASGEYYDPDEPL